MSDVIELDKRRDLIKEGWKLAKRIMCLDCGCECSSLLHPGAKPVKLECPECGAMSGIVMEWEEEVVACYEE